MKFEYMYIEAKVWSVFSPENHREIINKYSKEGWRYVGHIPTTFSTTTGNPKRFDLIFEKPIDS